MTKSKVEVENAVLFLGKYLKLEEETKLLLANVGLNSTVKEIIFRAFVAGVESYFVDDDDIYEAMALIRIYCREMRDHGEVRFNETI